MESMPSVLSNGTGHSKWNFILKSPSLSGNSRFPLCLALVKIRTYLSGGNCGTREWEAEGDRSFPALDITVGLPCPKTPLAFLIGSPALTLRVSAPKTV